MALINNIAYWLLSSKETPKCDKQFLNWKQLSKVLLIIYENQIADCTEFIAACKKDNITIQVAIIYDGKAEQAPKPNFEHIVLDKKQFNFFGLPNDAILSQLNSKAFDALINLGHAEHIKALALSKLIAAKCKIANFRCPIFEITISDDKLMKSSDYLKQVIVYLNMIKTTNN
jgi:hypothetical protein